jgi:hypothetical protein
MARDRFANRSEHVAGHARGHVSVPREMLEPDTAQLDDVPVTHFEQRPVGSYTPPAPPPADMPVDPDKWRGLSRKRRRELIRYHRKQVRGR